jgi:hypothetical protein
VQHIAEHGLTPADVEYALNHPLRHETSRSSGRPIRFGRTPSGERIVIVFEEVATTRFTLSPPIQSRTSCHGQERLS